MFQPKPLKRMLEFMFPPDLLVKFGHRILSPRVYKFFPSENTNFDCILYYTVLKKL